MSRIWGWFMAALSLLVSVLLLVLGQRDKARQETVEARTELKGTQRTLEKERSIEQSRTQVRNEANEIQKANDLHRSAGTRPATFGDSRLRNRRTDQ